MTARRPRTRRRFSDDLKRKLCQNQNYRCMYCGRRRAFSDLEIDHKTPVQRGGSDNLRNLQVLCPPCNRRKGNQTDREFRRRYRTLLPSRQELPAEAIRQDAFDMVTATTKRPRHARLNSRSSVSSPTAPAAIDSLNIRRDAGFFSDSLKFAWTAPDSEEPITGYRMQYRVVSDGPDTGWLDFSRPHEGNLPSFEVGGVPRPQRFAFRIRARSLAGWGPWSRTYSEIDVERSSTDSESKRVQFTLPPVTHTKGDPPESITEVSFERISGVFRDAVIIRWSEPMNPVGFVTDYEVQFRMHQGDIGREWTVPNPQHDGRDPSYRFNNVPKPSVNQFSVRIRAKNDAGWGSWSEEFPDSSM